MNECINQVSPFACIHSYSFGYTRHSIIIKFKFSYHQFLNPLKFKAQHFLQAYYPIYLVTSIIFRQLLTHLFNLYIEELIQEALQDMEEGIRWEES